MSLSCWVLKPGANKAASSNVTIQGLYFENIPGTLIVIVYKLVVVLCTFIDIMLVQEVFLEVFRCCFKLHFLLLNFIFNVSIF